MSEQRKLEIAAMPRKELNGHAYLLEREQEEYEAIIRGLKRKLEIADIALDNIEDMCNNPHDVKVAEEALRKIRAESPESIAKVELMSREEIERRYRKG